MKSNVFTDSILKKREAEGKLTIADNVTLALADALAELFPELPIHTGRFGRMPGSHAGLCPFMRWSIRKSWTT